MTCDECGHATASHPVRCYGFDCQACEVGVHYLCKRRPCIGDGVYPCPDGDTTLNDPPRCRDCDLDWYASGMRTDDGHDSGDEDRR